MTAVERLALALDDLETAGRRWPCRGRDEWISESHRARTAAAELCDGCPVIDPCAQMALETRTTFGVWAGRDLTPTPRKKAS